MPPLFATLILAAFLIGIVLSTAQFFITLGLMRSNKKLLMYKPYAKNNYSAQDVHLVKESLEMSK